MRTLQLWAAENRIGPATILAEEHTGRQLSATSLPELASVIGGSFSGYYPSIPHARTVRGSSATGVEVILAWVLGVLGIACCMPLSWLALVLAIVAKQRQQSGATAALIFSIISVAISTVGNFFWLPFVFD
jgi:hypothetical protein